MTTQIPPPRVAITDPRTGLISREWYRYLLDEFESGVLGSGFLSLIVESRDNVTVDNDMSHVICGASANVYLMPYADRNGLLSVTNAGTGTVTVYPSSGETINGESVITLDFRWTSIQLCPTTGGYVII